MLIYDGGGGGGDDEVGAGQRYFGRMCVVGAGLGVAKDARRGPCQRPQDFIWTHANEKQKQG